MFFLFFFLWATNCLLSAMFGCKRHCHTNDTCTSSKQNTKEGPGRKCGLVDQGLR